MLCRFVLLTVLATGTAFAADPPDVRHDLQMKLKLAITQLEANPDDVRSLLERGDAHFFLGEFDAAVRDYSRMIELNPALGPTHWQRGLALYYAGKYEDAAKQFERYYERDKSDRENGIWRFYAQVKKDGVKNARKALLPYTQPDREPLPIIYQLCAGEVQPVDVAKAVESANVTGAEAQKRRFYADLYLGLDAAIVRSDAKAARPFLEKAIANPWPRTAGYGPNYMWHVARLSLNQLAEPEVSASEVRER